LNLHDPLPKKSGIVYKTIIIVRLDSDYLTSFDGKQKVLKVALRMEKPCLYIAGSE
jgi:hypothetical protein